MADEQAHETSVRRASANTGGHNTRWVAWCSVCWQVGLPQELKADAEAIADRHREVQGFETPGSLGQRLSFQPIQSRTHGYNGQEHR